MKGMKKKVFRVVFALLLIVFIGSVGGILFILKQYKDNDKLYAQAAEDYTEPAAGEAAPGGAADGSDPCPGNRLAPLNPPVGACCKGCGGPLFGRVRKFNNTDMDKQGKSRYNMRSTSWQKAVLDRACCAIAAEDGPWRHGLRIRATGQGIPAQGKGPPGARRGRGTKAWKKRFCAAW